MSTEGAEYKSRSQAWRGSSAESGGRIVPTIALLSGRDDIKLGLRFEPCSRRAPTARGLSKSAIKSAEPARSAGAHAQEFHRERIAATNCFYVAMARKNHEFTSSKISVLSPQIEQGNGFDAFDATSA